MCEDSYVCVWGAFKGGVQQGFGTQLCYEAPSDLWVKQVLKTQ